MARRTDFLERGTKDRKERESIANQRIQIIYIIIQKAINNLQYLNITLII